MKPLNKKLIPYSKAFKQVSKVIGKEEALKQLELVWDCPECFNRKQREDGEIDLSTDITGLFVWAYSPQGQKYWYNILFQIASHK